MLFCLFCYLYSYLLFLSKNFIPTQELPLLFLPWHFKSDWQVIVLKVCVMGDKKWFCLLSSL